jgi:hypothetical protein
MDTLTLFLTIILFAIVLFILSSFFGIIAGVKGQTQKALRDIEDQIKNKLLEKVIETGIKQSKNIYKYGSVVVKSIAKNFPFQAKKKRTSKKKVKTAKPAVNQ